MLGYNSSVYPPLAHLVPHRALALLLSGIVSHDRDETICDAVQWEGAQYEEGGRIDASVAVELMAQTAGVHMGLCAVQINRERPSRAYLISVPRMRFFGGDYSCDVQVQVRACLTHRGGSAARFEAEVTADGCIRARGTIVVFEHSRA